MSAFSVRAFRTPQGASETKRPKGQDPGELRIESRPQAGWNDAYATQLRILSPLIIDRVETRIEGLLDAVRSVPVEDEKVCRLLSRWKNRLTDSV